MFLYLGGVWMPIHLYTLIHLYAAIPLYAPRGVHPPYTPILLWICMFLEAFACCGGCKGLPFVLGHFPYTTLVWGASPSFAPPHLVIGSLCTGMFWGYQYVMWAFFPSVEGVGCSPSVGGVGEHQHLRCPYPHSCSFL